jgi:plastocyanin
MKQLKRIGRAGALPLLLVLAGLAGAGAPALAGPSGGAWIVQAGGGADRIAVNMFMPASARVRLGDMVTWRNTFAEPHTVTFLGGPAPNLDPFVTLLDGRLIANPAVGRPSSPLVVPLYQGDSFLNSGLIEQGQSWSVVFDRVGTHSYVCLLHPNMLGQVVVEPAGGQLPDPAALDLQAGAVLQASLAAGRAAYAAGRVEREPGADGATRWHIKMGGELPAIELLAFLSGDVTIAAGDTVVFDYNSHAPHSVLFAPGDQWPPLFVPEPQAAGPPLMIVNTALLSPSQPSGGVYDGESMLTSGLFTAAQYGTSWSATFTRPGTYAYVCSMHRGAGMSGTITVLAAQAPATQLAPTAVVVVAATAAPTAVAAVPTVAPASPVPQLAAAATARPTILPLAGVARRPAQPAPHALEPPEPQANTGSATPAILLVLLIIGLLLLPRRR